MRKKVLTAGAIALMATALQGCAVYEYVFGGPEPEDMNEIIMRTPAPTQPADLQVQQQAPQYPTSWQRGQLLDR